MLTEYLFYGLTYYIAGLVVAVVWRLLPDPKGIPGTPKPIYQWFSIMTFWPILVAFFGLLIIVECIEKLLNYKI